MTPQLVNFLNGRAARIGLDDLMAQAIEKVRRQGERSQPLKLFQLLFQRFDSAETGIGAK